MAPISFISWIDADIVNWFNLSITITVTTELEESAAIYFWLDCSIATLLHP